MAPPAGVVIRTAREVAFEVVLRVFEGGAYADRAFRTAVDEAGLDRRDRAFAMQLAYGAVQMVRPLDHGIELLGRRPVRRLDAPVRAALRLGAYQLAFASGVPVHAAVNETVELVRAAGLERAVPFTNAVMRRLSVGLRGLIAGLGDGTATEAALKHSYPDWVAEVWWRDLGRDAARALMHAQNEPAETALRINRRLAPEAGIGGRLDPDLPDARVVERIEDAWLEAGWVWPQSRGSQLAALAVASRPDDRVLDLCAAPGGKATQLAGAVTAVERDEARARRLAATCRHLGATNVTVVHADGLELPGSLEVFDRALVDAPCSGLGTLASRPDLRWRAEPLPELQLALLQAAAGRVRPGGALVYSVCTVNSVENEDVVDALGLEPDDLGAEWPRFRHPTRPEFLLTLPHRDHTSGFFVARLKCP